MQRLLTEWMADSHSQNTSRPTSRRRVELNDLYLPLTSERQIREGIFVVRAVPDSTVMELERMIMQVNSDATTMNRLWTLFGRFQELNPHDSRAIQVSLFVVDMVEQGVKPSSALTYSRILTEAASRAGEPFEGPVLRDVIKALSLRDALDETDHAPDVDEDTAWKIVLALTGRARLTGFFLLAVGCRCGDGQQLTCGSISLLPGEKLAVSFRVTKNHRSSTAAYSVKVKPRHFVAELAAVIRAPAKSSLLLLSATEFNTAVRENELGKKLGLTSYSFRRCFIQNTIHDLTEGDVTDWLSVAKLTGHLSIEVLRNKYTQPFQNTL